MQLTQHPPPAHRSGAGPRTAERLTPFARTHLSHVKTPRRIDFRAELPRHDTGKLYKRLLRDEYWGKAAAAAAPAGQAA